MEDKILDELLKTTFTLDGFRKKYQVLKKKIEVGIYGKDEEGLGAGSSELEESYGEQLNKSQENKESSHLSHGEVLGDFDMSLVKDIKNDEFVKLNEAVEQFLRSHEPLSIYFVFLPADAQIREIGKWLRESLKKPRLIFDVKVDPGLIGGCAIAYKGVYRDFSIRAKIQGRKDTLIDEFRKYLKQ